MTRPRVAGILVTTLVAGSGCAGPGSRPPPGAQVIGAGNQTAATPLQIGSLAGFVGAGYVFTDEEQSGADIERTEHALQERAGAGGAGTVYSPNFLRWELAAIGGLTQDWADSGDGSEYDTGELIEGYADLDFFPTRIHPGSIYFSRVQDIQPRVFFTKVENTTTTYGARQDLHVDRGSVRVQAERRELDQQVFAQVLEPFLEVEENSAGISGDYRISQAQTISGSYQFLDVEQMEAERSFDSHNILGTHSLRLGENRRHELRSRLEVVEQNGSLDQELLRWTESWRSRITETLDGDIGLRLERNETNLFKLDQLNADAGLQHRLYESLNSSLRIHGGVSESNDESETTTTSAAVSLNYTKKTPWGSLRVNYSNLLDRRIVENDAGGAIDEPYTFPLTAPEEVRLPRPFVDLGSVVITDPGGLVFYNEGTDYTLSTDSADFTTITRVFAGNIPLGGSILVDYTFRSGNDYTLDTLNQRVRAEHEFRGGLTPYFGFAHQDQNFTDVEGPGGLEAVRERSLLGGLEWRGKSSRIGGEYETRESTVLPFDAVRLNADTSLRLTPRQTLTAGATQAWLFYEEPERDVASAQGTLRWRADFGGNSTLSIDSVLRYDDDSRVGTSFGFAVSGTLDYRWRKFRIGLRAVHRETNGVTSDFRGDEISLRIVRVFGAPERSLASGIERFLSQ